MKDHPFGARWIAVLGGAGIGAGAMYLLDPDRGRRRRSLIKDKLRHSVRLQRDVAVKGARDLAHRSEGAVARLRGRVRHEAPSDDVLEARVRSKIGRWVSHPSAIDVKACAGDIVLRGDVLDREHGGLVRRVRRIRGVSHVVDDLSVHDHAEGISALQGPGRRLARAPLRRDVWPPSTRLLMIGAAAGLGTYGLYRRGAIGWSAFGTGATLLMRSVANRPISRLFGAQAEPLEIRIDKTVTVHAPVERVFSLWSNPENFPRFMSHLRRVERTSTPRCTHWEVEGPGGTTIRWDAELTEFEPNSKLGWRTLPGAQVQHDGTVHFESIDDRATRLQIQMSYRPPVGIVGHAVAALFRKDPKHALDEDIIRMKSLLEVGHTTIGGQVMHEPRNL